MILFLGDSTIRQLWRETSYQIHGHLEQRTATGEQLDQEFGGAGLRWQVNIELSSNDSKSIMFRTAPLGDLAMESIAQVLQNCKTPVLYKTKCPVYIVVNIMMHVIKFFKEQNYKLVLAHKYKFAI